MTYKPDAKKILRDVVTRNYIINFDQEILSYKVSHKKNLIKTSDLVSNNLFSHSQIESTNLLPLLALNYLEDYLSV